MRRAGFHDNSAHYGGRERRLFQKAVNLLGKLFFGLLAGDRFGGNGDMQPDLRACRQTLDGLSLLSELTVGVALCTELKDDLRQHDGRVFTTLVCLFQVRSEACARALTTGRRGKRDHIARQTGLRRCGCQRTTGKEHESSDALQT